MHNSIKKLKASTTCLTILLLMLSGCSQPSNLQDNQSLVQQQKVSIVKNYTNIVYANYQDSLDELKKLQKSIDEFVKNPTESNFSLARKSWLDSRIPYEQTEGFRFYDGPIDEEDGERINSWPIDEVAIDYVEGNKLSGIINDSVNYPDINKNLLIELNHKKGEKNNLTGFHAIEFLLWGQDLDDNPDTGQRKYTDYLNNDENINSSRRGQYLKVVTDLLIEDMEKVTNEWQPENINNYQNKFLKMNTDDAINNILEGVITLSGDELAGVRMGIPLDSNEGFLEQSPFSNNTKSDLIQSTKGIQNILNGSYTKSNGTTIKGSGIYELINNVKPELYTKLKNQFELSSNLIDKIQNPFDQEISVNNQEGNTRVKLAIDSFITEKNLISDIKSALNISISNKE